MFSFSEKVFKSIMMVFLMIMMVVMVMMIIIMTVMMKLGLQHKFMAQ